MWRALAELAGRPHGCRARPRHRDDRPRARLRARRAGQPAGARPRRRRAAPSSSTSRPRVVEWYAAIDPGRSSGVVSFVPGTPRDLVLDVSPGGDLHVTIVDADTPQAAHRAPARPRRRRDRRPELRPRLPRVRGGARHRRPARRGEHAAALGPLPRRRDQGHRVERRRQGRRHRARPQSPRSSSRPRHVVPTPGVLGCDLHVHARPSFDSPGHARGPRALARRRGHRLRRADRAQHRRRLRARPSRRSTSAAELSSVTGVEVTTYNKGFGHFGVFPYPPEPAGPAVQAHDDERDLPRRARRRPEPLLPAQPPAAAQGHRLLREHRLRPQGAALAHPQPDRFRRHRGLQRLRRASSPSASSTVLRDYWALLNFGWRYTATGSSDSHRIQFHWAGYPRTMVTVDPRAGDGTPTDATVDPLSVVAAHQEGPRDGHQRADHRARARRARTRATRSARPTSRSAGTCACGRRPGSTSRASRSSSAARVVQTLRRRRRARPSSAPSPGRSTEAAARTIRFDRDIDVPVGPDNGWVQIIARGERRMDDVLPFMPVPPLRLHEPGLRRPPPRPAAAVPRLRRPAARLPEAPLAGSVTWYVFGVIPTGGS